MLYECDALVAEWVVAKRIASIASAACVTTAERVPAQDESLELEGFNFRMLEVSNTRIEVVHLHVLPESVPE